MIFIPGSLPLSQHLLTDPGHAVREIADDGVHSAADHSTDVLLLIHGPGINLNTMALDLSHHLFRHVAKDGVQAFSAAVLRITSGIQKPGFCQKPAFQIRTEFLHPADAEMIKGRNDDLIL